MNKTVDNNYISNTGTFVGQTAGLKSGSPLKSIHQQLRCSRFVATNNYYIKKCVFFYISVLLTTEFKVFVPIILGHMPWHTTHVHFPQIRQYDLQRYVIFLYGSFSSDFIGVSSKPIDNMALVQMML